MSDFGTSPVAAPAAPQPAADTASLEDRLQQAGLRVTRQRMALGRLLFNGQHQHINAEELHRRAIAAKANLTLATVYNTLHQFRAAGLLREVAVSASSIYFDTDTSDHHHFFIENDGRRDRHAAGVGLARHHSGAARGHGSDACRRDRPRPPDRLRPPRGLGLPSPAPLTHSLAKDLMARHPPPGKGRRLMNGDE